MSLSNVFIIREANVGNIKRLLGLTDRFTQHVVKVTGKKYAYPLTKVFVDDMRGPWKMTDVVELSKKGDEKASRTMENLFWAFMSGDDGLGQMYGAELLSYLRFDPNLEKFFYSHNEGSEELNNFLKAKLHGKSGKKVIEYPNGWYWKQLTPAETEKEGALMQHCGSSAHPMYSLRDLHGKSHVSAEVDTEKKCVGQIRGKQNKFPVEKYWDYVRDLEKHFDHQGPSRTEFLKSVRDQNPNGNFGDPDD